MKTKLILMMAVQLIAINLFSQTHKQLNVGDQLPSLVLKNVENYKSKEVDLSTLKGKVVILDFWATTCVTCIAGWPKLRDLQDAFGSKIQIFLVNSAKFDVANDRLNKFLKNRKENNLYDPKLPSVVQLELKDYFPHYSVPHVIIIDKLGLISAIIDSRDLTKENIQKIIDGIMPDVVTKGTALSSVDFSLPLFVNGNGGDDNSYLMRSMILPQIRNSASTISISQNRIVVNGALVSQLYRTAYSDDITFILGVKPPNIDIQLKDSALFRPAKTIPGLQKQTYGYEVIIPENSKVNVFSIMKCDLDNYFNIDSKVEKRDMKCLILKRTSNIDKISSEHGGKVVRGTNIKEPGKRTGLYFRDVSFKDVFIRNIRTIESFPMLIDEANYNGYVTLELDINDLSDIAQWKKAVKKYDLELVEEIRPVNVLVLKDRPEVSVNK